ncbi:hypothetical protein [Sphingobacterium wenxiniae]|uniref:Uncharacterized protein n=1 Tax=Sphingobacterium wenxiniae TaxID=683125 RepID=A0A1I6NTW2_9SPHI|nr:hypothetical protein [Sphingobacterium wenxiniae]SFS31288.1 hypothetical protein SAMN05660206_10192 [Sphingobacterium wenxiniae]
MQDSKKNRQDNQEDFPDYPHYDEREDIFEQEKRIEDERVGQIPKSKSSSLDDGLDIPGAELDDEQEEIGSEDEENNYYSLGGDNHEDLEQSDDL